MAEARDDDAYEVRVYVRDGEIRHFSSVRAAYEFAQGNRRACHIAVVSGHERLTLVRHRVSEPTVRKWYGWKYSKKAFDVWEYVPFDDYQV